MQATLADLPPALEAGGSRLLAAFRADVLRGAPLPCTAIDPRDPMLRFLVLQRHGHREGALVDYLWSGASAARTIGRLLDWRFGAAAHSVRLLDFASGYGRVTRFLVQRLSPRRVWVSDILPGAVEFQQRSLGVHGFASAALPEELACPESFDCVVAASLFSHLPASTFVPWLRRLLQTLRPGGMLVLSVHDASLLSERSSPPPLLDGYAFQPSSEITALDGAQYGTAWVTETSVRAAVEAAAPGAACLRWPRALWSFQDLYVISRDEPLPPPTLLQEPLGFLEGMTRSTDLRSLSLRGWAVDLHGPGVDRVEVLLDGEVVAAVSASGPRGDVGAFLSRPDLDAGGWACAVERPEGGSIGGETTLSIRVHSRSSIDALVHLGTVESTDLALALRDEAAARERAEANAAAREAELAILRLAAVENAWMRASRFWKLREAWWSLRRAVGVGGG